MDETGQSPRPDRVRVELSEDASEVVRERMAAEGITDAAAYLESLVMADLAGQLHGGGADVMPHGVSHEDVERRTMLAEQSGACEPVDDAYWDRVRQRIDERVRDRKKPAA